MSTTVLTHGRVTWTNIIQPTRHELNQLGERYPQFHPLNLHDCLTPLEFPKLDHHDDYIFIVAQLPSWDPKEQLSRPCEVDIFVARGVLVTVHQGELKPLNELFARAQADEVAREALLGRGASPLLYDLLNAMVDYCYPILHKVNHNIRHIERNLFQSNTQHILSEVAIIRRDVIALRHILRPQLDVVRELERGDWPFIHEDLNLYWGDISSHLAQQRAMLDEHFDVINGLSDTIHTLASHRIDEVVRLLTLITILTVPLTLLSTIFGMNVQLPYGAHPLPFFAINALGIVVTIVLLWYLRQRGWF
jgi:magnesium transporter